jgi:ABC-type branched-subunit amino acid transport system substrate-binding protein
MIYLAQKLFYCASKSYYFKKVAIFSRYFFLLATFIVIGFSSLKRANTADLALVNENAAKQAIILASSSALSGPTAQLGLRLNQGARIYFTQINRTGGIAGRSIEIQSLDDGYEPYKTLKNTHLFLKQKNVFALFNYVGTPTTYVVYPQIKNSQLPFLMPFTGANFLRTPVTENVFNLRASYYQEAKAQIDYLIKERKLTRIGLLVQADKFGVAVEEGYLKAMKKYGVKPVVVTRYRRNTEDVALALSLLKASNVEAVSFVGTYEPFAELINSAAQQNFTPFFTTVSFISSRDLFSRIKQQSNILVSEVMPDPHHCSFAICQKFNRDMKNAGVEQADQVQFEGYLNAYLFVEVAKLCVENLNQACFLEKISHFSFDFGGIKVNFSPDEHQGLDSVFLNFFEKQL